MKQKTLIKTLEESDHGIMIYTPTWYDKFLFFNN